LSEASVVTLEAQGGLLHERERLALAVAPDLAAALTLRRADDDAKVAGAVVPDLDTWRPVVAGVAEPGR